MRDPRDQRQAGRPSAVLVAGAPGSGKSTIGALVASRLPAALLDLDTATASMVSVVGGLLGTDNLDDPRLSQMTRDARYEAVTALAEDNLALGLNVVVVAPFSSERRDPAAWEALSTRMREAGADPVMVWVRISAEEVLRRVEARGAGRDTAKLSGDWVAGLDLGPPAGPHLEVDGHLTPTAIAEIVLASPQLRSTR